MRNRPVICASSKPKTYPRSKVSLPFADPDEAVSEIISKILLLAQDHKIKSQHILAQIVRSQRSEVEAASEGSKEA